MDKTGAEREKHYNSNIQRKVKEENKIHFEKTEENQTMEGATYESMEVEFLNASHESSQALDYEEYQSTQHKEIKVCETSSSPEDYIRNFLLYYHMEKSFNAFQTEWYNLLEINKGVSSKGFNQDQHTPRYINTVPDIHLENIILKKGLDRLNEELEALTDKEKHTRAREEALKRERSTHYIHVRQAQQEKMEVEKRLKIVIEEKEASQQEITSLCQKLSALTKEISLLRLDRDRKAHKIQWLEGVQAHPQKDSAIKSSEDSNFKKCTKVPKKNKDFNKTDKSFRWPNAPISPYIGSYLSPSYSESDLVLTLSKKAHTAPISGVSFDGFSESIATASDDGTWKLWSVPDGNLIKIGRGHESWVSDVSFHPRGELVATSSGDCTIKIWNLSSSDCLNTLKHHIKPVWNIQFDQTGEIFASASLDCTAKCFDTNTLKCRQTFKGHSGSVNYVTFIPFSSTICTASKDKTVSLWDLRSGKSILTFYGHMSSCNQVKSSCNGQLIASCDTRGVVKIWNLHNQSDHQEFYLGPNSANCSSFDQSGSLLAVGTSDSNLKIVNLDELQLKRTINEHKGSIQGIAMDNSFKMIATTSADCTFKIWTCK